MAFNSSRDLTTASKFNGLLVNNITSGSIIVSATAFVCVFNINALVVYQTFTQTLTNNNNGTNGTFFLSALFSDVTGEIKNMLTCNLK